ncbi:MAG: hypothetical protein JWM34_1968 [Ilumatobacteraceae bacterium]|nr:hypothetical protein [Ilumatobacteraceae bacterium]
MTAIKLRLVALAARPAGHARVTADAVHELTELLDLKSCRYVAGALPRPMPELLRNATRIPANVDPLAAGQVAIAVAGDGRAYGHLVLVFPFTTFGVTMPPALRRAAVAIADHAGAEMDRLRAGNG